MKNIEEIKAELERLRNEFANRNIMSQDYSLEGFIIKGKYKALEWVLGAKHCFVCGLEHNNSTMVCSEECSKKLYG